MDSLNIDLTGFPVLGSDIITLETYNTSRYSDRFEREDFSRMTKQELKDSKKKILEQIKELEAEQEEEKEFSKRSYLIDEQIEYRRKQLHMLDFYLDNCEVTTRRKKISKG